MYQALSSLMSFAPVLKTAVADEDQAEFVGYNLRILQYLCKGSAQCRGQACKHLDLPLPTTHPPVKEIVLCSLVPIAVTQRLDCFASVSVYNTDFKNNVADSVELKQIWDNCDKWNNSWDCNCRHLNYELIDDYMF